MIKPPPGWERWLRRRGTRNLPARSDNSYGESPFMKPRLLDFLVRPLERTPLAFVEWESNSRKLSPADLGWAGESYGNLTSDAMHKSLQFMLALERQPVNGGD